MRNNVICVVCGDTYDINTVGQCYERGLFPVTAGGRIIKTYREWLSDPTVSNASCFRKDGFFGVMCEKCLGDNYIQRT